MVVSEKDRRNWERQVAALELEDSTDEGSLEFRAAVIEWANSRRAAQGRPDLDTEGELHHRARALGLLGQRANTAFLSWLRTRAARISS